MAKKTLGLNSLKENIYIGVLNKIQLPIYVVIKSHLIFIKKTPYFMNFMDERRKKMYWEEKSDKQEGVCVKRN